MNPKLISAVPFIIKLFNQKDQENNAGYFKHVRYDIR